MFRGGPRDRRVRWVAGMVTSPEDARIGEDRAHATRIRISSRWPIPLKLKLH